jgi:uncharacterized protein YdhG (YjbR/CyaY superfamily)
MKRTVSDVESYIASAPEWARRTLQELRRAVMSAAPNARESISYKMPYYSSNGRLAYFAAHANHCGFYWISPEDRKMFAEELSAHRVVGSTLQVRRGEKVPVALIKRIVKARLKNNERRRNK